MNVGLFTMKCQVPARKSNSDKRRTFHGSSNNTSRQPVPITTTSSRHQRSRSAINSEIVVSSSRSTNSLFVNNRKSFGLHTLNENTSVEDMINTLKTLPPIITPPDKRSTDDNSLTSREAALAEAEAKLMGTFKKREDNNGYLKKRASLQQLAVLNEHNDSFSNKRSSMNNKSLSLSLNNNTDKRRSSRNFDDWRNSK